MFRGRRNSPDVAVSHPSNDRRGASRLPGDAARRRSAVRPVAQHGFAARGQPGRVAGISGPACGARSAARSAPRPPSVSRSLSPKRTDANTACRCTSTMPATASGSMTPRSPPTATAPPTICRRTPPSALPPSSPERRARSATTISRALNAAGYDDAEIIEIVLQVGLNTLASYINKVGDPDIDFPLIQPRKAD